jgi:pilus assembly protein CpaF
MGWEVITPFLRPIEPLLQDPEITDILVNGAAGVFIEKQGRMQQVPNTGLTERSLQVAIRNIARVLGDEISPEKPLLAGVY